MKLQSVFVVPFPFCLAGGSQPVTSPSPRDNCKTLHQYCTILRTKALKIKVRQGIVLEGRARVVGASD